MPVDRARMDGEGQRVTLCCCGGQTHSTDRPRQAGAVTSFSFSQYFLMWTFFKVFVEFVTVSLLFYVFAFWPHGMCMWDLCSLSRD